jgi:hypothetical protein
VQVKREAKGIESGKKVGAASEGCTVGGEIGMAAVMDMEVEKLRGVESR